MRAFFARSNYPTAAGEHKVPARRRVARSLFAPLAVTLAALWWCAPLRAQEHGAPANAPHAPTAPAGEAHSGNAPAGETPGSEHGSETPKPTEPSHGTTTPEAGGEAPGTGAGSHTGAPAEGETSHGESGHAPGGHAEGGHGEGEHEEESFSIHLPTWIYGALKSFWHSGPATLTAAGAVDASNPGEALDPATLNGKQVAFKFVDHHAHQSPKPTLNINPTLNITGKQLPAGTVKTEEVEVDGRKIILVDPADPAFAYQSMVPEGLVISLITAVLVAAGMFWMTRGLTRIPSKKQVLAEMIYSALDNFTSQLIGPGYKTYLPLIATSFIYIFMMNWGGVVPGWGAGTANINVTAGMALVIVAYVQFVGIRANGFKGYVMHFVGEPKWLFGLNVPIHVIGELAKILSLTIRLFGNIFGEDVVLVILISLAVMFTKGWVPFQTPMYLLVFFTSFVQAMVFSILTCVYIALMTTHDDEGHHGEHGHAHDDHGHLHDTAAPATVA